ncbi:putative catalytic subunit of DNA polymerase zeta UPR-1 [Coleophoma cylindrospora]|uniref:DNA polymerase n=1 Tax=Coleophoma cylindrospora TaxID=1849047 RepID=A0A3D8RTG4_9HELO|nr:putative catalytic subunit of DNA polymerase zeta UPR-1 [Coleophoma cylindrospora]
MDIFRVRLNCIDHYQSVPTRFDPQLRNNVKPSQLQKEPKVPVIRVFGATETGQKVCAHIHGAFPYLYIEYHGSLLPDDVGVYVHRLHLSIDYALAVSYRRNLYDGNAKFVARIVLVKGIPFYGYHVGFKYFLKIYMLNPMVMTRLADLLRQGVIMKKVFQPYEAHLQYLLQWMTDYNLYGCGYIDCKTVSFRSPVPRYEEMDNASHLWHDRSIRPEHLLEESDLPRVSHCSIEVDICVQDIINRHEIKPREIHHDFIERVNPLPPTEKLVQSMAGLWRDETRRRKSKMVNPTPGSSPFPPEVMISMSADPRYSQAGGWIHEEEYREMIMALITDEGSKSDDRKVSFESFVKPAPLDATVKTSLQAVEDLYPENLRPALGLESEIDLSDIPNGQNNTEVDENRLRGFGLEVDDDFPYDSDEEVMRGLELSQLRKGDQTEEIPTEVFGARDSDYGGSIEDELVDESLAPHIAAAGHSRVRRSESPSRDAVDCKRRRTSEAVVDSDEPHRHLNSLADIEELSTNSMVPPLSSQRSSNKRWVRKNKQPTVNSISRASGPVRHMQTHQQLKHPERSSGKPLNFPVVKDPQEPSTILRLSQKGSSQSSVSVSPKKKFLVEPSIATVTKQGKIDVLMSSDPILTSSRSPPSKILASMGKNFGEDYRLQVVIRKEPPPSRLFVTSTMLDHHLPQVIHRDAYYSNELDVPERAREWAGREFKLESLTVPFLPDFDATGSSEATFGLKAGVVFDKILEEGYYKRLRGGCSIRSWKISEPPPAYSAVKEWSRLETTRKIIRATKAAVPSRRERNPLHKSRLSQIDGPTQKNKHGFKYTQNQQTTSVRHEVQYMSTMSLEIHVNTRGTFVPNPEEDEIQCLFWCLQSNEEGLVSNGIMEGTHLGIVALSEDGTITQKIGRQAAVEVQEESSELDLIIRMVEIVRRHDPDVLTGFEVHGSSWGYLIERARLKYDYNLCDEFSRMKTQSHGRFEKESDKWGFNTTSTIRVTGRHMINIWRAMRSELNLLQYTMENIAFHLLHRRVPHFSWADLTRWYTNGKARDLSKVLTHYLQRVQLDLEILEQNELIPRTSEQARLLGVDFFSVFSRGSQFKVESLMFRIAKAENFMLVSPSRKQVGGQNALECLPLVMEPQSAFYSSPLLVLDFQSLYPSVMIAYNYCYSTFLGRIVNWRGTNKMGFTEFKRQQRLLELLKDHINIAPNGMMYTKPEIRKSLLAKMLGEILETRVMVKSGMKIDKGDKTLQRLLNNRQLALKLIANVTYGYTSASFSGRMPCSEIADSIVQTGRETLEKAIALIHSVKRWGAEVVYGDTDSLFVHLKGRSKDQAFDIGNEIAKTITDMNPRPVKLKFEKVYFPCVLLAKKRYVGFKYESREQKEPDFDAKGIETVRRDGTPAEQKIEETALKILFRTADLSQVKEYFQEQCEKIMSGSVSIQDFCFAREVKLGTYSDKGPPPPGALISTKRMLEDARAEPQYGERVPYVIVTGAPGARLIDRCVAPEELLQNDHSELDSEYYISKNIIPPLERIFNLMGANVRSWYDEMPKVQRVRRVDANLQLLGQSKDPAVNKKTLESYLKSSSCLVCKDKLESEEAVCPNCLADKPTALLSLRSRLGNVEKKFMDLQRICQSCSGISPLDDVRCDSKDCPVFYTRTRHGTQLKMERAVLEPVMRELSAEMIDLKDLEW